jgi:hypothetical protein
MHPARVCVFESNGGYASLGMSAADSFATANRDCEFARQTDRVCGRARDPQSGAHAMAITLAAATRSSDSKISLPSSASHSGQWS